MPNLFAFLTYAFVTSVTPGPNNIMSMTNAGRFGFRKSVPFNFGVAAGFFVVLSVCAVFTHYLAAWLPAATPVLKVAGALYILWLAFKTLRSSYGVSEGKMATNSFFTGMVLQFINPKGILYAVTSLSAYVTPYYSDFASILFYVVVLTAIALVCTLVWVVGGSLFNRFFVDHAKAVNVVMALLLVYCAISLFL